MVVLQQQHEPKQVLITGGCGFIGSNFVNFVYSKWPNANLVNVDKLILNSDINFVNKNVQNSNRYKLVLTDIRNTQVILRILQDNNVIFYTMF